MTKYIRTPVSADQPAKQAWIPPGFVYFRVVNATVTAETPQPKRIKMFASREPTSFPVNAPVMAWNAAQAFAKEHDLPFDLKMCYHGKEGDETTDHPVITFFWGNPQFNFVVPKPKADKQRTKRVADKVELR